MLGWYVEKWKTQLLNYVTTTSTKAELQLKKGSPLEFWSFKWISSPLNEI